MNSTKTQNSSNYKKNEHFLVAIELGSSKAKIGVAGFNPDDKNRQLTIYNITSMPTVDSVRYGRIVNIREVTDILNTLVCEMENKYPLEGRNIIGTYLSIGGRSLKSRLISASLVLPDRREITDALIDQLKEEALETLNTTDELIWIEPVRYSVDNMPTPRPVGTLGSRLTGEFTAVVCNSANKSDIENVIEERVALRICGGSVRPIALSGMLLSNQEKKAGCMLVDFGAETITVSVYKNYALQYLATIPLGSRLITRDLATILAITEEEAEMVKLQRSNAMPSRDTIYEDDQLQETINAVVSARLADIIANIDAQPEFAKYPKDMLAAGIILSGGGAKLSNFAQLLEKQTGMKVRIATLPREIVIMNSDISATDNLDLIALLNESAKDFDGSSDKWCVAKEEHPKAEQKEVLIDITSSPQQTQQDDVDDRTRIINQELQGYGYEAGGFGDYEDMDDKDDDPPTLHDDFQGDDYILSDSDEIEDRLKQQQKMIDAKKRKQDRKIEKEEAKRRKQQERLEKKKEEEEKKDNPPQKPNIFKRLEWLKNKTTGLLSDMDEDNSAEL